MARVAALLRSINVGGNRMKMDFLREVAREAGARDVATVLASGNVLLDDPGDLDALGARLEQTLEEQFGVIAVVMRTHDELVRARDDNPWHADVESGNREGRFVHTMFLRDEPAPDVVAGLEAPDGPDEFVVRGRHVFAAYAGSTQGSPLDGTWFERRLGTGTMRNHNTVRTLVHATA